MFVRSFETLPWGYSNFSITQIIIFNLIRFKTKCRMQAEACIAPICQPKHSLPLSIANIQISVSST